jgi:polyphosphate kinase
MQKQILKGDILLNYPYESMDHFLSLIKESAADPAVISIKISLYRIDRKSKLAEHLISAAENGKDVTVLMELRARFDEQNNIEWAERLEEAGCKVNYGFEGFKVHAKVCLITRREKNRLQYITQIGTGNYNEKTAALYSDLSLLTANQGIGRDAALFFKNMSISNLNGTYSQLLVAPSNFKRFILALIEGEIDKTRRGRPASILFKLNSLTDRDILDKLSEASRAGVQVRLLIRGICCILPGIPERTENISITNIVGRFLEHARIYVFGTEREAQVYIASADLMTRNTQRRVETACPILDEKIRKRILDILKIQLQDNVKARTLLPDGTYQPILPEDGVRMNSQEYFIEEARKNVPVNMEKSGALREFYALVRKRFRVKRDLWPE